MKTKFRAPALEYSPATASMIFATAHLEPSPGVSQQSAMPTKITTNVIQPPYVIVHRLSRTLTVRAFIGV